MVKWTLYYTSDIEYHEQQFLHHSNQRCKQGSIPWKQGGWFYDAINWSTEPKRGLGSDHDVYHLSILLAEHGRTSALLHVASQDKWFALDINHLSTQWYFCTVKDVIHGMLRDLHNGMEIFISKVKRLLQVWDKTSVLTLRFLWTEVTSCLVCYVTQDLDSRFWIQSKNAEHHHDHRTKSMQKNNVNETTATAGKCAL